MTDTRRRFFGKLAALLGGGGEYWIPFDSPPAGRIWHPVYGNIPDRLHHGD